MKNTLWSQYVKRLLIPVFHPIKNSMKRTTLFLIATLVLLCNFTNVSGGNWYQNSRYGLFVHYVPELTIYPTGGTTTDINVVADNFNVKQLADDAQAFGMEYVMFTVMHYRMRPLYPSAVTEKWRPGNSSTRDVIRDLINELKPRGIKLILYVHSTDGYDFSTADQVKTGFNDPTGGYLIWNNYVNELFTEIGLRYGSDIDGLWQDMCYDYHYANMIDKPRIRKSMLTGDPNRIIVGSGSTLIDGMDYTSKEYYPPTAVTEWRTYADQIVTVVGGEWWAKTPKGTNAARLSSENLYRFSVLQASTSNNGGMAWDAGVYIGGGFEDGVKEMFTGCAAYMNPVKEAIKGTLPSTSYPSVVGKSLSTISNGIVATRSYDNQYEYIHVLYPPAGKVLTLPAPADGKIFGQAILLNSGNTATVTQTAQNVIITLGDNDNWSTVNSVLKLKVKSYTSPFETKITNNTDTIIKYSGVWWNSLNRGAGDYRDDVAACTANGNYFTFDFEGNGIDYITPKSPEYGLTDIYVDGVYKGQFTQYATAYTPQQAIYSVRNLPDGKHTLKAVKASGAYFQVDELSVIQSKLKINTTSTVLNDSANSVTLLDVTSESEWTAVSSENWLTIAQNSGKGSIVGISVKANSSNPDATPREAILSVSAGGQTAFITFKQEGKTTGLTDIQHNSVRIYPNPSNGVFAVEFSDTSEPGDALIYNTLGEIVKTASLRSLKSEIDITGLEKGIYFVKITGKSEIFKIIKQ